MKTKIIPAINAKTFEEIKEKINLLKDLINHFHLDVASLEFTGYQTYPRIHADLERINADLGLIKINQNNNPRRSALDPRLSVVFDLHLMLSLKPQEILKWAKQNVKTLILHLEASQNPDGLLKMAKKTKKKIFIAWSPVVEFNFIKKYLNYIDGVLILGVKPGKAGQKFLEETYKRIEVIKEEKKRNKLKIKLMVDGGINRENFDKILSFNPDYIVMASAIYSEGNPKENYLFFNKKIKNV
jgi:ribulose-phosphate 3-epimerase